MLTTIQKFVPSLRKRHSEAVNPLRMKTILYVEDDEHDVFFLRRAFRTHAPELRLENVTSVSDAIEYLNGAGQFANRKEFPLPDLVVSDVTIPGGSGFELVRWIRDHSRVKKIPVILLTGTAQELQVEKAQASGADFCIEKSTDFKELLAKIQILLEPRAN